MDQISRRAMLLGTAAVAAALALPAIDIAPAAAELPAPPPVNPRGWWGYSTNGGEWFNGPFDSREDALVEAQGDRPDENTVTAWCVPYQLSAPDLREHCIEWLGGWSGLDPRVLKDMFEGSNEDHDYEGEVGEALHAADYSVLIGDLKDACANALFRAGRLDLIGAVYDPDLYDKRAETNVTQDESLRDSLGRDVEFERDCDDAAERWMVAQDVRDAPRMLRTEMENDHEALEPVED